MNRDLLQRIFTLAYTGLRAQGFNRAIDGHGGCVYRDEFGRRCAIGHAISDKYYSWKMEGNSAREDVVLQVLADSLEVPLMDLDDDTGILQRLQNCHDVSCDPDAMRKQLEEFAERHQLVVPA